MRALWWLLGIAVVVACGSDVSQSEGSGGAGGSTVDPGCFQACVDKGVSEEECNAACTEDDTKTSSKSSTQTSTGSAGGGVDELYEKSCYVCMEENAGDTCGEELKACEASLACLQLRDCPFTCGEKPGCIEECNEIIPTGVAALTALVQCMSCGVGPCSDECSESLTQAYCE